jgi:hypothetical protein
VARFPASGDEVLVVFRAADAYISPNWYPSKHEPGPQRAIADAMQRRVTERSDDA